MADLAEIVSKNEEQIRAEWIRGMSKSVQRMDLISKTELEEQCQAVLKAVVHGMKSGGAEDLSGAGWNPAKELLLEISASRARQGFSTVEVATFVLSLKQPLFAAIRRDWRS